ncbi:nuclear fusion protein, putative [Babesia ovis]|uniref:Nuclear fusion protein, putative n=1 Tax=Babesia ovis TaxID=5869 RepID=A0A9W5TDP3_BABOV|nr:nuclear fusion protein, putative [Babesia ovis]
MGLLSIFAVVLFSPFAKLLASTADYKNWYGTAQNSYSRGKSTYDDVLKAAQEREEECVILHSADRQIAPMQSNEWATDIGREQFPCLRQYDQNGILAVVGMHIVNAGTTVVFDINANIEEIAGPTRKQRVMAEGGCWQFVLNQINQLDVDSCDIKGEVSRSLIALAKTKCHFIRSRRAFPLAEHGCILDPQMIDDNALGIYKEQYVTNPCKYDYTSDQCQKLKEDIVAQCTNLRIMSESAFQMYHANLNHIGQLYQQDLFEH